MVRKHVVAQHNQAPQGEDHLLMEDEEIDDVAEDEESDGDDCEEFNEKDTNEAKGKKINR